MPRTTRQKKLGITIVLGLLFTVLCSPLGTNQALARKQFDEYQVKLAFLFNLANFVTWSEEHFAHSESPFFIVILGKDPFGSSLDGIVQGEKVRQHPIVVKRIKNISELQTAHILYIHPDSIKKETASILDRTARPGLLTVSDSPGFASDGGGANLMVRKNRLFLELNVGTTKFSHLKFSSKLLQLAKVIGKESP